MDQDYLDQMQAHVDAGGKLTHQNAVELLEDVRQRAACNGGMLSGLRLAYKLAGRELQANKPLYKTSQAQDRR